MSIEKTTGSNEEGSVDNSLDKIYQGVEALTITRKRALNAICSWIILQKNKSQENAVAISIMHKLNQSFAKAGLFEINKEDFFRHLADKKERIRFQQEPSLFIQRLQICENNISEAFETLRNNNISVGVAQQGSVPWEPAVWSQDQAKDADLVLFSYYGDWTNNISLGAIAMGEDKCIYLESALESKQTKRTLQVEIWKREDLDMSALSGALNTLQENIIEFNITSNTINSRYLGISIPGKNSTFQMQWNGKTVESSPSPLPVQMADDEDTINVCFSA